MWSSRPPCGKRQRPPVAVDILAVVVIVDAIPATLTVPQTLTSSSMLPLRAYAPPVVSARSARHESIPPRELPGTHFQLNCRSIMQRVLNIAPLAPVSVSVAPRTRVTRARVAMKVASLDSVASQMDAAGFDKEDAYRRFDELLGTADVSFNQGDRVSTISELATCAAHSSFPPANCAARGLTAHCISNVASDGRMTAQLSVESPSQLSGSDSYNAHYPHERRTHPRASPLVSSAGDRDHLPC